MIITKTLLTLATTAALALGAISAHAADEPGAWDKFKTFTLEQKNEAVATGEKAIAEIDKKIAEIKKSAKNSTAETKQAHEANMKDLQARKQIAQAELNKLKKASGNAWDATKEGFSNAWKDLGAAYDKAKDGATK